MNQNLIEQCSHIYRGLLGRDLNADERVAIEARFGSGRGETFNLADFIAQAIKSDEFFAFNREYMLQRMIPKPCIVRAKGPLGDELFVDLRQLHLGFAIATGHFEPAEVAFVKSFVKPGFHVLDIGANIGFFTNMFARLVGSSGSVHAFEPVGDTYRKLVASINVNGWGHVVQTYNLALANSVGTMEMSYAEQSLNMGGAHLVENSELAPGESREWVRIAPLEDLVPRRRYDFVKMDVEGAERMVIQGAESLIRAHLPPMMIEFNDLQLRAVSKIAPEDFAKELISFGYHPYGILDDGGLSRIENPVDSILNMLSVNGIVNLVLMNQ